MPMSEDVHGGPRHRISLKAGVIGSFELPDGDAGK